MIRGRGREREEGFALFVVLAFLLIAAAVTVPFFTIARQYAFLSRNSTLSLKEHTLSDALLRVAAQRYSEVANGPGGAPSTIECDGSEIYPGLSLSFRNHAGQIDLNAASGDLLTLGFMALGAEKDAAALLASTAEAYRVVNTGSTPDDERLAVVGGLKHASFESTSELFDFELPAGVDAGMIEAVFTIHSQSATLDKRFSIPPLRRLVDSAGRSKDAFAIEGRPSAAFTVEARLYTGRQRTIHASAIYTGGLEGAPARRNGPMSVNIAGADLPGAERDHAQCASFFDRASLSIIADLMQ